MAGFLTGLVSSGGFGGLASGLGSIGAGILGSIGSSHAAKKAYKYQKKLMDHQFNLTRQLNQNAYQDTTYSMRQAGINPMLAISQGVNGLSAGSGGSVNVQNPVEAGNAAYALHKQVKNETKLRESQEELNASQGSLNRNTESLQNRQGLNVEANTAYTQAQKAQLDKFGPLKAQAEINQINAGSAKILNDIKNSNALIKSQIGLNSANTARVIKENSNIRQVHGPRIEAGRYGSIGIAW